jgi:threonine/homoserine/homoserine lactone efflux protein
VDSQLLAFIALTFLLAVTPGISTAVVVRNVIAHGRRGGYRAAAGVATANATWAVSAAIGLSALVARAPRVLDAIRYGGAAFLVYLALRSLRSAVVGQTLPGLPGERVGARHPGPTPYLQGLAANLLHPSIAVYYLTVVPSFLPTPEILQPRFALYAAIHITMAFACHVLWGSGFHALREFWERPRARRLVNAAIAIALLVLAVELLR